MSANISSVEGDENLCRVCMVSGSKRKTLLSIFDKLPNDKTTFVEAFTALELGGQPQDITNDDFTKKVCKKCTEEVQKVYNSVTNLRQKCQETHLKLTEIANCQKIEAVDVIIKEEGHDEYVEEISPSNSKEENKSGLEPLEKQEPIRDLDKATQTRKSPKREITNKAFRSPTLNKKFQYCCQCTKSFPTESDLQEHFGKEHINKIKPHHPLEIPIDLRKTQCTLCKKMVYNLRRHRRMKTYTERRKKLCKYCGKTIENRVGWLMCCERGYENCKFQCSLCSKTFSKKRHLKAHLKKHSQGSVYKCDICDKEMTRKGALKVHLLRHNKKLNHQCADCSKAFVSKQELKRHRAIHMKHMARASAQLNDFQPTP